MSDTTDHLADRPASKDGVEVCRALGARSSQPGPAAGSSGAKP
ncbi:MAG TPA: hypothetical protein VN253_23360 [Kofleriaceae bacterium]|nr:hypothetical protein [Kofleriaceae bacterium]